MAGSVTVDSHPLAGVYASATSCYRGAPCVSTFSLIASFCCDLSGPRPTAYNTGIMQIGQKTSQPKVYSRGFQRCRQRWRTCLPFFSHSVPSPSSLSRLPVELSLCPVGTLRNKTFKLSATISRPPYRMRRKYSSTVSARLVMLCGCPLSHTHALTGAPWKAATNYVSDNEHAFVSSDEMSACSVEPGCAQDVGLIVRRSNSTVERD
jgi:hypothetical protein